MLEIQNLKAAYGKNQVLKGASLELAPGTAHGILGMNGAGKTTFFETIYGRKPRQSGQCLMNGQAIKKEQIAYLESESYFYPFITGKEHLELCSHQNPSFKIEAWNELFQLPLQQLIETYSTGMKQKLALLGALATGRPLIIMDEPFNGVDLQSSETIYQLIDHLKQQGHYLLISSHIMDTLTHTCDQISHLSEGVFQHTYQRDEFPHMQQALRASLKRNIQQALDGLNQ